MNQQNDENELDWLAFCYAAGELSGDEAAQFEARLADNQEAREALARAVELSQAVAAVEAQSGNLVAPVARTQSEWNARLSWMAIGGVASLLIALLWSGALDLAGPRRGTANQRELALAWNMTRSELADVKEAGLWLPSSVHDEDDLSAEAMIDDMGIDESPSWLTAAVFARADESSNEPAEPFSHQRLEN